MAGATRWRLRTNSWRLCTRVEKRQVLHRVLSALLVYLFGRGRSSSLCTDLQSAMQLWVLKFWCESLFWRVFVVPSSQ